MSVSSFALFADRPDYLMLFRKYVSRTAAGKGREVLKCLGFDKATLHSCYKKNGLNVEEAIQEGLYRWCQGKGTQPPTWEVLLGAMCFAECAQKHIQGLKQQLGMLIALLCSVLHRVQCRWCLLYNTSCALSNCCICAYTCSMMLTFHFVSILFSQNHLTILRYCMHHKKR